MTAAPSALVQLLTGAPVLQAESADFQRMTWRFRMPPNTRVGAGDFVLVPAGAARAALQADHEREHAAAFAAPGAVVRAEASGAQIHIQRERAEAYFWREHVPEAGREKYWRGPAVWIGSITRQDNEGNNWSTTTSRMVMDDYGDLVPVGVYQ